jgi:hypothetical protein
VLVVVDVDAAGIAPMLFCWQGIWCVSLGACLPAYVATNFATSRASFPVTMFCGMIAPEKPPFSIA